MTKLFVLSCLVMGTIGSGCALPPDDTSLESLDEPIHMWGYTVQAGRTVAIDCSPYPYGSQPTPWIPLSGTASTDEPLSSHGETVYPFNTWVVALPECWGQGYGPRTYLRARDAATGTVHAHFNPWGYECLVEEYFGGAGPITAYEACDGPGHSTDDIFIQGPL